MTRRQMLGSLSGLAASTVLPNLRGQDGPSRVEMGGAVIDVSFDSGQFDLPRQALLDWVTTCARAVSTYFGKFPVAHARLQIQMGPGRRGVSNGVTFGGDGAHTRIRVGQRATEQDLKRDWILTHEMVHYGFPNVDADCHWIEEGSATYVEPIARVMIGELRPEQIWGDMMRDMHQGLPAPGDQGLDHTHTWGRTYWGGALFCLLADVRIRQSSHNKKGLVDALRAINRAGGNVEYDWPLEMAFQTGDKATGGKALMSLWEEMRAKPVEVDLPDLFHRLGVDRVDGQIVFRKDAPLSAVRAAIA